MFSWYDMFLYILMGVSHIRVVSIWVMMSHVDSLLFQVPSILPELPWDIPWVSLCQTQPWPGYCDQSRSVKNHHHWMTSFPHLIFSGFKIWGSAGLSTTHCPPELWKYFKSVRTIGAFVSRNHLATRLSYYNNLLIFINLSMKTNKTMSRVY